VQTPAMWRAGKDKVGDAVGDAADAVRRKTN
jgi:hypothetical protein